MKDKTILFLKNIVALFNARVKSMGRLRAHKALTKEIAADSESLFTTLQYISTLDTSDTRTLNANLLRVLAEQVKPIFAHWKGRAAKIKNQEAPQTQSHSKAYSEKKAATQAFYQLVAEINTAQAPPLITLRDMQEIKKPGKALLAQYNNIPSLAKHEEPISLKHQESSKPTFKTQ